MSTPGKNTAMPFQEQAHAGDRDVKTLHDYPFRMTLLSLNVPRCFWGPLPWPEQLAFMFNLSKHLSERLGVSLMDSGGCTASGYPHTMK
jgi:hypothetical protein